MDTDFKERVDWVFEDGYYSATMANLPVLVQAKTMEEMKTKCKVLAEMWISEMAEMIAKEEPFEYVENLDWYKEQKRQ